MKIEFIELEEKDLAIVKDIYDYYILNSTATFHTEKIKIEELKEFILIGHPKYKSYLIYSDGEICGYCYFIWYKKRQAYDRTAEVTLYLKPEFHGKGIGKIVLERLEPIALNSGIKNLLGIITGENSASIALFEKCGYQNCANFRQVGEKFGRLLDVLAYQKIIG
jgi:phosphinothricin acetyltransferase